MKSKHKVCCSFFISPFSFQSRSRKLGSKVSNRLCDASMLKSFDSQWNRDFQFSLDAFASLTEPNEKEKLIVQPWKLFRVDSNFVTDMLMLFGWLADRVARRWNTFTIQPASHEFHKTWQNLLTVTEVVDFVVVADTLSLAWFWLSVVGSDFLVALLLLPSSSEESSTGSSFLIRRGILSFMFLLLGTLI